MYGYYSLYLKVDHEEFGGHETLLQEGMFASMTLFLVSLLYLLNTLVALMSLCGSCLVCICAEPDFVVT